MKKAQVPDVLHQFYSSVTDCNCDFLYFGKLLSGAKDDILSFIIIQLQHVGTYPHPYFAYTVFKPSNTVLPASLFRQFEG